MIKLEEFDEAQIREWVRNWNNANTSEQLREMSAQWALMHRHLAAQPLLLLMLTLYRAHRGSDADDELSSADLYGRLFDDYAQREISKREGKPLHGHELTAAVGKQLRTLAVAALGMFNRGRQDITEIDLGDDLEALEQQARYGQRLLAEFFFIHSPEAREVKSVRSYEFLHATFAEYLVAERVVDVLRDVAEAAYGLRVQHEPEDDLLFALLSHQPLAVQQPVIEFVHQKLATLDQVELERIRKTIDTLLTGYRSRRPSRRFGDYRPTPPDVLRSMAAYSANLVLLRIQPPLAGSGARLENLFTTTDPLPQWRTTVDLWKSALDESGYHSMLGAVDLVDGSIVARVGLTGSVLELQSLHHARLSHDRDELSALRHGAALTRSASYLVLRGTAESKAWEWFDYMSAWLLAATALRGKSLPRLARAPMPPDVTPEQQAKIVEIALGSIPTNTFGAFNHEKPLLWLASQLGEPGIEITTGIEQQKALLRSGWQYLDEFRQQNKVDTKGFPLRPLATTRRFTSIRDASPPFGAIRLAREIAEKALFFGSTYHCVSVDESGTEIHVHPIDSSNPGFPEAGWEDFTSRLTRDGAGPPAPNESG